MSEVAWLFGSRGLAWSATLALTAAIAALSLHPKPHDALGIPIWDKLAHFLAYGALALPLGHALLLGRARPGAAAGAPSARTLALAALGAFLLASSVGAALEGLQSFVPGRTPSGLDILANAIGAALGASLAALAHAIAARVTAR